MTPADIARGLGSIADSMPAGVARDSLIDAARAWLSDSDDVRLNIRRAVKRCADSAGGVWLRALVIVNM